MTKLTLTVKEIMERGLWDEACTSNKWNPWILNEGLIDAEDLVTFEYGTTTNDQTIEENGHMTQPKMDKQSALDVINTMPVKYYDNDFLDGKSIIYIATVEDNEENRHIIKQLGFTNEQIDQFQCHRDGELDLTNFVWDYADWFDGHSFSSN